MTRCSDADEKGTPERTRQIGSLSLLVRRADKNKDLVTNKPDGFVDTVQQRWYTGERGFLFTQSIGDAYLKMYACVYAAYRHGSTLVSAITISIPSTTSTVASSRKCTTSTKLWAAIDKDVTIFEGIPFELIETAT